MKIFLDISSLFKLYHREADSNFVEELFFGNKVTTVFLSELTKIVFVSFLLIDTAVVERSKELFKPYVEAGLRTFDSRQLATAISLKNQADLFRTADNLLNSFFRAELLPTH